MLTFSPLFSLEYYLQVCFNCKDVIGLQFLHHNNFQLVHYFHDLIIHSFDKEDSVTDGANQEKGPFEIEMMSNNLHAT